MGNFKKPSVYVSYARETERQTGIVKSLENTLPDIEFYIDRNKVRDAQNVRDFIKEMSSAKYLLLVLSKEYFKSYWCMEELTQIVESSNGQKERIFVIRDSAFPINETANKLIVRDYWEEMLTHANDVPRRPKHLHTDGDYDEIKLIGSKLANTLKAISPIVGPDHSDFVNIHTFYFNEPSGFDRIRAWLEANLPELRLEGREWVNYKVFEAVLKRSIRKILLKYDVLREELALELGVELVRKSSDAMNIAQAMLEYDKYDLLSNILFSIFEVSLQETKDTDKSNYESLKQDIKTLVNIVGVLCTDENNCERGIEGASGAVAVLSNDPIAQILEIGGLAKIRPELDDKDSMVRGKKEIQYPKPLSGFDKDDDLVNDCLRKIYNTVFEKDKNKPSKQVNDVITLVDRQQLNERLKFEAKNHTGHFYFFGRKNENKTSIFTDPKLVEKLKDKLPALDFFIAEGSVGDPELFVVDEIQLSGAYSFLMKQIDTEW